MEQLLTPSGVGYALAFLGGIAACRPRRRAWAMGLLGASAAILTLFSSGVVAAMLMSPLEYAYPSVHSAHGFPAVQTIVVLTGYAADDPDMPLVGRLNASSAQRVTMTLQLYRSCPDCRVIISGNRETARIMGQALVVLGLPESRLQLEDRSRSTAQSAQNLAAMLGHERFFLVTSAGHMPRTIEALQRAKLDAIAVPTDHLVPRRWLTAQIRPSAESLAVSDLAFHEYIGRLWYRLRSQS